MPTSWQKVQIYFAQCKLKEVTKASSAEEFCNLLKSGDILCMFLQQFYNNYNGSFDEWQQICCKYQKPWPGYQEHGSEFCLLSDTIMEENLKFFILICKNELAIEEKYLFRPDEVRAMISMQKLFIVISQLSKLKQFQMAFQKAVPFELDAKEKYNSKRLNTFSAYQVEVLPMVPVRINSLMSVPSRSSSKDEENLLNDNHRNSLDQVDKDVFTLSVPGTSSTQRDRAKSQISAYSRRSGYSRRYTFYNTSNPSASNGTSRCTSTNQTTPDTRSQTNSTTSSSFVNTTEINSHLYKLKDRRRRSSSQEISSIYSLDLVGGSSYNELNKCEKIIVDLSGFILEMINFSFSSKRKLDLTLKIKIDLIKKKLLSEKISREIFGNHKNLEQLCECKNNVVQHIYSQFLRHKGKEVDSRDMKLNLTNLQREIYYSEGVLDASKIISNNYKELAKVFTLWSLNVTKAVNKIDQIYQKSSSSRSSSASSSPSLSDRIDQVILSYKRENENSKNPCTFAAQRLKDLISVPILDTTKIVEMFRIYVKNLKKLYEISAGSDQLISSSTSGTTTYKISKENQKKYKLPSPEKLLKILENCEFALKQARSICILNNLIKCDVDDLHKSTIILNQYPSLKSSNSNNNHFSNSNNSINFEIDGLCRLDTDLQFSKNSSYPRRRHVFLFDRCIIVVKKLTKKILLKINLEDFDLIVDEDLIEENITQENVRLSNRNSGVDKQTRRNNAYVETMSMAWSESAEGISSGHGHDTNQISPIITQERLSEGHTRNKSRNSFTEKTLGNFWTSIWPERFQLIRQNRQRGIAEAFPSSYIPEIYTFSAPNIDVKSNWSVGISDKMEKLNLPSSNLYRFDLTTFIKDLDYTPVFCSITGIVLPGLYLQGYSVYNLEENSYIDYLYLSNEGVEIFRKDPEKYLRMTLKNSVTSNTPRSSIPEYSEFLLENLSALKVETEDQTTNFVSELQEIYKGHLRLEDFDFYVPAATKLNFTKFLPKKLWRNGAFLVRKSNYKEHHLSMTVIKASDLDSINVSVDIDESEFTATDDMLSRYAISSKSYIVKHILIKEKYSDDERPQHQRLYFINDTKDPNRKFTSPLELIKYYMTNSLEHEIPDLNTPLVNVFLSDSEREALNLQRNVIRITPNMTSPSDVKCSGAVLLFCYD